MTRLELAASHGDDVAITVLDDAARERGMRAVDLLTTDVEAYLIGVGNRYVNGYGYGHGTGNGFGIGDGNEDGYGNGDGNGYSGQSISIAGRKS